MAYFTLIYKEETAWSHTIYGLFTIWESILDCIVKKMIVRGCTSIHTHLKNPVNTGFLPPLCIQNSPQRDRPKICIFGICRPFCFVLKLKMSTGQTIVLVDKLKYFLFRRLLLWQQQK